MAVEIFCSALTQLGFGDTLTVGDITQKFQANEQSQQLLYRHFFTIRPFGVYMGHDFPLPFFSVRFLTHVTPTGSYIPLISTQVHRCEYDAICPLMPWICSTYTCSFKSGKHSNIQFGPKNCQPKMHLFPRFGYINRAEKFERIWREYSQMGQKIFSQFTTIHFPA